MKNLSALRPTLVTIGIGTNDLIQGICQEEFANNYQLIIARLKRRDAQIVLMNIADLSLAPAVPLSLQGAARQRILTFNKRIELIALSQKLPLVDLYSMTPDFSKHPEYFAKDGIHPSDAGYEFWARALWPKVHSALNKQRCH
jgi:lysophospholipase L1-like esterase